MRRNVFTTYDPNLPMGKKFVAVHVQNEDPLYFLVEVKAKVCELFVQISKFLNLLEPELFGLAIRSSAETFMFLDPFEKLSKYAPKSWKTQNNGMDNEGLPLFNVYFRVQFYVDSYLFISCKVAKYYYYHQLRENVLRYEQSMSEERAFLLASYALQADYGNYNAKLHKNRYFDPNHYFPSWVIEELGYDYILRYLPSLHCDHKGMSKSEAQSMFIREASDPMAAHNFHLYRMIANKKLNSSTNSTAPASAPSTDTWLAITITGLMIYAAEPVPTSLNSFRRLKTRISFFAWSDIGKLSFDKKKFEIRSIGPQSRKFTYYTGSEELARFLLWFSRASHQFHLMVLPKMREMLKREAEINRRKYRESCISTTNNRILSTSNGSNSSDSGCASNNNNNTNVPISNTSKSISPFEFGSSASSNSSTESAIKHKKCITSDLDISTTSSSVCFGIMDCNDSIKDSVDGILVEDQQRISVISNASSNTTSGIASDKIHSGLGEEDSDPESDLLMSLNGHHHHHRAITLSGCSPQPVVSMESLAMSEPINDNHRNNNHHHQNNFAAKSAMMRNKKHSISISNIMITTNADQALSPIPSPSSSNSQVKTAKTIPSAAAAQKTATTEIIVNAENTSKVSLCLEINDSKLSNNSPNADYSDLNDEIDSLSFNDNNNNRYSSSNNKSNVTVLSTILKPEAERLLKQGIEADDVIDAFNNSAANVNTIDSIELAELKQFEKQEKEKIILNSLIDNIPPPPALNSSLDSSDSDSDSDLSDDDDENNDDDYTQWRHYSPIAQEKRIHDKKQQQLHIDSTSLNQDEVQHVTAGRLRSKSSNANDRKCNDNSSMNTHIYENVPFNASINANDHNAYSRVVQALITTPHKNLNKFAAENVLSLRPYPSLNSVPTGTSNYPHRTGMRIGISSLSRPSSAQKNVAHLLLQGGCVHATNHYQQNSNHNIPSSLLNGQALCSLNSANISAGSEPNLYFDRMNQFQQMCTKNNTDNSAIRNVQHSQLSTVVAKQPIINKNHFDNHTVESSMSKQPLILNFSKPNETMSANFDSNIYITSPPSADYHKKTLDQVSPFKNSTSSQTPHNTTNQHLKSNVLKEHSASTSVPKKSKELRLKELRQRTSDLNLPLITALFNDSSLQLSNRFLDHPPSKSRSMQHLTSSSAITNTSSHNQHKHHHSNGNCSSGGCTSASSSSSTSSTPSRASPSSVERSCTFRVDEVIAKSAIRRNDVHNDSGKNRDENYSDDEQRPISWHIDKSNPYVNATTVPAQNGWHNQFYVDGSSTNHNNIQSKHNQSHHQSQQPRRSSTGNSIINGGLTPKMIIQPTMTHQFYKLRS